MKRFKLLLLTFAISVSTVIFAANAVKIYGLNELSAEVENFLRDSNRNIEEGSTVTIFFSISEDKTIQYVSVAAQDHEITSLLEKKLINHPLDGIEWREGMIYELAIASPNKLTCLNIQ